MVVDEKMKMFTERCMSRDCEEWKRWIWMTRWFDEGQDHLGVSCPTLIPREESIWGNSPFHSLDKTWQSSHEKPGMSRNDAGKKMQMVFRRDVTTWKKDKKDYDPCYILHDCSGPLQVHVVVVFISPSIVDLHLTSVPSCEGKFLGPCIDMTGEEKKKKSVC